MNPNDYRARVMLGFLSSPNLRSYAKGETVAITSGVTSGGSPVANASVIFTVMKPNSAAMFRLRLKRQDPAGVYAVRVDATSNTLSANATTRFMVQ